MNPNLPERTAELIALAAALAGIAPPCRAGPDSWFDADPTPAIRACRTRCHALEQCAAYAAAVQPTHGVWAGINRARQHPQRQEAR